MPYIITGVPYIVSVCPKFYASPREYRVKVRLGYYLSKINSIRKEKCNKIYSDQINQLHDQGII